ncbi:MAG: hypothetical protein OEW39_04985 [Deltaproteobacteria bacterium]|nr:hypothetical protein [Deltaproteobacteria bacterium]
MSSPGHGGDIPFFQKLFDNPIALLVLGLAVMFVLFTGWGMIEIMTLPTATLP